jgi:CSLREA domain-containing protein
MGSRARRFLIALAGMSLMLAGAIVPGRALASGAIVVNTVANENNNDGDCSLREAVSSSNTDSSYDACTAGSSTDTVVMPRGTFKLDSRLVVSHNLTIRGAGRSRTVIDAEQSDRVLLVDRTSLTLERLSVTGGESTTDGGGISDDGGKLSLINASVTGNRTGADGGGIAMSNGGVLRVTRSLVADNLAGGAGGGILAAGVTGGKSASVSVVESTISNNQADATSGSTAGGGGIHLSQVSVLSVIRSTVSGNRANTGAGIANQADAKILNSTISENSALGNGARGGGLDNSGNAVLMNATLDANSAGSGGNLYLDSDSVSVRNSIVGQAAGGGNCAGGQPSDDGGNLEEAPNGNGCGFEVAALQLGPLTDNGGPTRTQALDPHSPAVHAGGSLCLRSDQRGVPRQGSACDSGSYELVTCFGLPVDVVGTQGRDRLRGSAGPDVILSLGGDDRLIGRGGNDRICAGKGNDIIGGDKGSDRLNGFAGDDICDGGPGRDLFVACETRLGKP